MACIRFRFRSLVLAIIIIATSNTVLGKNEEAKGAGDKEDGIANSVSSALGRKMHGLRELYSEKIVDTTTKIDEKAARKIGVFKSDDTVLPKANNGKQHLDAVAEMFNMLNKDYQARAHRRPPINNGSPLEDDADHLKH
ncbi:uncharacterized protein LOC122000535 [Zingiber officinale]|uniref:uncharacterized protein LOC122000535 n=1 Tax=Zingiber officinale TaxID=94328 RepID=UPI001C4BC238|nr:uncharacterized protein LOC122000535 [Zingiber officinale]